MAGTKSPMLRVLTTLELLQPKSELVRFSSDAVSSFAVYDQVIDQGVVMVVESANQAMLKQLLATSEHRKGCQYVLEGKPSC